MLTKNFYEGRIRVLKTRIASLNHFLKKEKDPVKVQAISDEIAGAEYDLKKSESDSDFATLKSF